MSPRRRSRLILFGVLILTVGYWAWAADRIPPVTAAQATRESPRASSPARITRDELMTVVRELSSPQYEGRRTGSKGGRSARAYLRSAMASIGLEPATASGFEQAFRVGNNVEAANLLGRVRGTARDARAILVTAHYDHLGIRNGQVYPGADDNASGVAALLALARYVKVHPMRHDAIFAALDAEELGLDGAKAFVARPPVPLTRIAIAVNLDMVSRSDRHEIFAAGTYQYPWLLPIIAEVRQRASVKILLGHDRPGGTAGRLDDWTMQSDHGIFYKAGVPFLYFGVEDHPDYHRSSDTADRIDPNFYRNVVEMVLETILSLDRR